MKKLLSLLTVSVLIGTSGVNLVNTKLFTNNASGFKNRLTTQQNNNQTMTRYDSLNLVNEKSLNNAINSTIKNINKKCKNDINWTVNGKNYNYKNELLKVFSNKENLLTTNNQYEQFLSQNNNYQKNNLGLSFPMNYDGVYFPWWGLGDYFYWYMSSDTVKKIQQYLAYGQAAFVLAVNSILLASGVGGPLITLVDACLFTFTASWYMDNVPSFDNGNGVYLGISILPAPTIFEVGSQDKYISKVNSFEVDYKAFDGDYITACVDEQGVNFLLNYYNYYVNNQDFVLAEKYFLPYLKSLKPIDNTGWGGSITEKDYTDWGFSFWLNDNRIARKNGTKSLLENFVNQNPNFKSIDIRTQRDSVAMDAETWEIWKNS
ncbi:MAG: hypothetical protein H9Q66_05105 [Spiroplasma ixodetis]|nr:hypothetical protein [Spiroplasma ixodetis]